MDPELARACGVPAVGVRAVDCWQWRSGHYFHQSFPFFPVFFLFCFSPSRPFLIEGVLESKNLQGASKKSGICFMITISIKFNTNMLGINLIWNEGSIALSGLQKKILYNIREPRYKQIKLGYQNFKKMDIRQSRALKSHFQYHFAYSFGSVMLYRKGVEYKTCLRMSPLRWDISQPPEIFLARKIMHKSRWSQIKRS